MMTIEVETIWNGSECENTSFIPKSYEDCHHRSTEFVYETCCYLKGLGVDDSDIKQECVDIIKDDTAKGKILNQTRERIKNGTYWENFNNTYKRIDILKCYSNYVQQKLFLTLFLLFL